MRVVSGRRGWFFTAVCLVGAGLVIQSDGQGIKADESRGLKKSEIIVSARGWSGAINETPGSKAVIESSDIVRSGTKVVIDSFCFVPGVWGVSDGPIAADVSIRGLQRDAVITMVDGARIETATDLGSRLGFIDPLAVERIEILKGPISTLHGSGSMGGVIEVVTRKGSFSDVPERKLLIYAGGSDNPVGASLSVHASANAPESWVYAGGGFHDYEPYYDGDGKKVRNSGYTSGSIRGGFAWKANERHILEANFDWFEADDSGVTGGGTAPLPANADVTYDRANRTHADLLHTFLPEGDFWKSSTVKLYYQGIRRDVVVDNFPPAMPLLRLRPSGTHDTFGFKWNNELAVGPHRIAAGADTWRREMHTERYRDFKNGTTAYEIPVPNASFLSSGMFIEDDIAIAETFGLNVGGRLDRVLVRNEESPRWGSGEEEDFEAMGHIGVMYDLLKELKLKAMVASGYRAASLEERFQFLDLGGGLSRIGDPELEPERNTMFEVGMDWLSDRVYVSVSVFANYLDDMIGDRIADESTIVNANIDTARIAGWEAEARINLCRSCDLILNIAGVEGRDTKKKENLAGIPPLSGAVGLDVDTESFGLLTLLKWAADQNKTADGEMKTSGWATVNVRGTWSPGGQNSTSEYFAEVSNLFDYEYRDHMSTVRGEPFNEPGRAFKLGVMMRL